jgi:hypothetical protein
VGGVLVRGPGWARGAIAPALIFWFFCIKAKEQKEHHQGKKKKISFNIKHSK